jgi:putative membrane protein
MIWHVSIGNAFSADDWAPAMVPPADSEFRDHAANERTMLAWIRTGVAFMGFGFAIARFGLFLREVAQVGQVRVNGTSGLRSSWFGVALVVLGFVTNAAATVRYARARTAIAERRSAVPSPALAYAVGAGSAVVAVAMAALLARALSE